MDANVAHFLGLIMGFQGYYWALGVVHVCCQHFSSIFMLLMFVVDIVHMCHRFYLSVFNIILCVLSAINFAQVLLMLFEVLQMLLMLLGHFWCCSGVARLFGVLFNVIISVSGVLPMYV
jgi:hypothetical protein